MHAKQLVNVGPGEIELRGVDMAAPGSGEVSVQVTVSAISPGTERAWGLGLPDTPRAWPRTTGYSVVGEVTAVGADVDVAAGTRVHAQAPHASAVLTSVDRITELPDAVSDRHAAFLAQMQIALGGVRKARVELGESVLVIGGGLIGQLATQFAHAAGAGEVLLAELSAERRAVADACGVAVSLDPRRDDARASIAATGAAGGPDVVIEVTGAPEPIRDAFGYAGRYGRVVLLGSTRGETEAVNFYRDVHKKGLTIIGGHNAVRPEADDRAGAWTAARDNRAALRLLQTGRLTVDPLITHEFAADDFRQAYDLLFDWDDSLMGCLLRWR